MALYLIVRHDKQLPFRLMSCEESDNDIDAVIDRITDTEDGQLVIHSDLAAVIGLDDDCQTAGVIPRDTLDEWVADRNANYREEALHEQSVADRTGR